MLEEPLDDHTEFLILTLVFSLLALRLGIFALSS